MIQLQLQQLVHGYKRGHELVATSFAKLDSNDHDTLARMSDLSGPLVRGEDLPPYLTAYPLPSGKWFALARTWVDENAPRAGCVATHTLLISAADWSELSNIRALVDFHTAPWNADRGAFTCALEVRVEERSEYNLDAARAEIEFTSRFFEDGVSPLVWFDASSPDERLLALLESAWPRLRMSIAGCSLALSPRRLGNPGVAEVWFAPAAAYSRFAALSPEQLLEGNASPRIEPDQEWKSEWTSVVFRRDLALAEEPLIAGLLAGLGEDPEALRVLPLVLRLRERIAQSPLAAVGLLDVAESIGPAAGDALDFKTRCARVAAEAAGAENDPETRMRTVRLVYDRLSLDAFASARAAVATTFDAILIDAFANAPAAALRAAAEPSTRGADSPYNRILARWIRELDDLPDDLLAQLFAKPGTSAALVDADPTMLVTLVKASRKQQELGQVADLIQQLSDDALRGVRPQLAVAAFSSHRCMLLERSLESIEGEEVVAVLQALAGLDGWTASEPACLDSLVRTLARHPEPLRARARTHEGRVEAVLAAATFARSETDFAALLDSPDEFAAASRVLACYLLREGARPLRAFVRKRLEEHSDVMAILLGPPPGRYPDVASALSLCLEAVPSALLPKDQAMPCSVFAHAGEAYFEPLRRAALLASIRLYCGGAPEAWAEWRSLPGFEVAVDLLPTDLLADALTRQSNTDRGGLRWVSQEMPIDMIATRPDVAADVVRERFGTQTEFSSADAELLSELLDRSQSFAPPVAHGALCADVLAFAFANKRGVMSSVVRRAFPPVYLAAVSSTSPPLWSVFGWFTWDKGKELRKSLVDSFMQSNWNPGDLILAAADAGILRKIYKRTRRQYGGAAYLQSALDDLRKRDETEASASASELERLLGIGDIREDWD